jgi:SAM-dependent methyltransferase
MAGETTGPQTWHYGLVARWWDEFNRDGPEIDYFRRFVEAGAGPALDAPCGTGRLLLPYLRAGLEVDGADVSPDMLELCRARAERERLSPRLYAQALHELDLPSRYRTIIVCGGFGLGGRREHDVEALRRLHAHLERGGTLVLDNEVPYADGLAWRHWPKEARRELPRPRREPGERRTGSDDAEYALRARLVALDPLEQLLTYEMRAWMWRDGELVAEEEHELRMTVYFTHELELMLERAGFTDIELQAGYTGAAPTSDDDFVVFVARRA